MFGWTKRQENGDGRPPAIPSTSRSCWCRANVTNASARASGAHNWTARKLKAEAFGHLGWAHGLNMTTSCNEFYISKPHVCKDKWDSRAYFYIDFKKAADCCTGSTLWMDGWGLMLKKKKRKKSWELNFLQGAREALRHNRMPARGLLEVDDPTRRLQHETVSYTAHKQPRTKTNYLKSCLWPGL